MTVGNSGTGDASPRAVNSGEKNFQWQLDQALESKISAWTRVKPKKSLERRIITDGTAKSQIKEELREISPAGPTSSKKRRREIAREKD